VAGPDERTGATYYRARLEISAQSAPEFDRARIAPGLDAEVFITTEERTFLDCVTEPVASGKMMASLPQFPRFNAN
jgi:hypothetical protein